METSENREKVETWFVISAHSMSIISMILCYDSMFKFFKIFIIFCLNATENVIKGTTLNQVFNVKVLDTHMKFAASWSQREIDKIPSQNSRLRVGWK
jgi:hypothetical protein